MRKKFFFYLQALVIVLLSVSILVASVGATSSPAVQDGGKLQASIGDTATYEIKSFFNNGTPAQQEEFYQNGTSFFYTVTAGMKLTFKVVAMNLSFYGFNQVWCQRTMYIPGQGNITLQESQYTNLDYSFPNGTIAGKYFAGIYSNYGNATDGSEIFTYKITNDILTLTDNQTNGSYQAVLAYNWKTGWLTKDSYKIVKRQRYDENITVEFDEELVSYQPNTTGGNSHGLPGFILSPVLLTIAGVVALQRIKKRKNKNK